MSSPPPRDGARLVERERRPRRRHLVGLVFVAVTAALTTAACRKNQERVCRVNEVCFLCPDEKEQAVCRRDPAASRCKWAEPERCGH